MNPLELIVWFNGIFDDTSASLQCQCLDSVVAPLRSGQSQLLFSSAPRRRDPRPHARQSRYADLAELLIDARASVPFEERGREKQPNLSGRGIS